MSSRAGGSALAAGAEGLQEAWAPVTTGCWTADSVGGGLAPLLGQRWGTGLRQTGRGWGRV